VFCFFMSLLVKLFALSAFVQAMNDHDHNCPTTTHSPSTASGAGTPHPCDAYCQQVTGNPASYCKYLQTTPTCQFGPNIDCTTCPTILKTSSPLSSTPSATTIEAPTATPECDHFCRVKDGRSDSFCKAWMFPPVCQFSSTECSICTL
jgi:hypothetical protein